MNGHLGKEGIILDGRLWTFEQLAAVVRAAKEAAPFMESSCGENWRECNKGWHQEEGQAFHDLQVALGDVSDAG